MLEATFHTNVAVIAMPPKKSPRGIHVSVVTELLFIARGRDANPIADVPLEETPKMARVTASILSLNIIHLRLPKTVLQNTSKF